MVQGPCRNPNCRSYGTIHPNCKCYMAEGGIVCEGSHMESCEHFADGGMVESNQQFINNPQASLDHVGVHHGLLGLLTKTGHSKSDNEHKHFQDFIEHSKKGHKAVKTHMDNLIGSKMETLQANKEHREALKKHVHDLTDHPEKLLEVGGSLGEVLPQHGALLAAKAGTAVNYFKGLRPTQTQQNPLDTQSPIDKTTENHYDRALDIANHPLMILQHAKDGTLLPRDLATLQILYPELGKDLKNKAFEQIVNAQSMGKEIPYKQKQSLSLLLDQPLDMSMTPLGMQAIIKSQAGQQSQNQKTMAKKASGVELNQINKVNKLDETSLQSRLMNKKD